MSFLINLESMGLLDLWFQLEIATLTSSFVVMELEDGGHANALACIHAGLAIEVVISGEEMAGAFAEFQDDHGQPSCHRHAPIRPPSMKVALDHAISHL